LLKEKVVEEANAGREYNKGEKCANNAKKANDTNILKEQRFT
jgi:hypothetical protein